MPTEQSERFDTFAIVELFGHTKIAGRVSEQTVGGASFIRVDVPELPEIPEERWERGGIRRRAIPLQPAFTRLFGASAIYSITPCSEEVALAAAQRIRPEPVAAYYLPERAALPAPEDEDQDDGGDDYDCDDSGPF